MNYRQTLGPPPGEVSFSASAPLPASAPREEGMLIAWREGPRAALTLGSSGICWDTTLFPRGMMIIWLGKGGGYLELKALGKGREELPLATFSHRDDWRGYADKARSWFDAQRGRFGPMFPGGLEPDHLVVDA